MEIFKKSLIDGYWEEGYHYYLEIKGDEAILRDYAKRILLKTAIRYDQRCLKNNEKTELSLDKTILSRTASGEPMTWIKGLYYQDGKIIMDYYYTIMGDMTYTLEKVNHDPFYDIVIRDKEVLPSLNGLWLEWSKNGTNEEEYGLTIEKNLLRYGSKNYTMFTSKIHAISLRSNPDKIILTPEDLTVRDFPGMTQISVEKNMLTSYRKICDVSSPMSVFVRREDYNSIAVPQEALREAENSMLPNPPIPEPIGDSGIRIISQSAPNTCGGTDTTLDERAPKIIKSKDMVLFDVTSALNVPSDTCMSLGYVSAFAAPAGKGTFLFLETAKHHTKNKEIGRSWAFIEKDVFPELTELVRKLNLVAKNGYHSITHGLPENFGGSINIKYADGERISISNNQSPILSASAGEAIFMFFNSAMKNKKIELPSVSELKAIRFDEERNNGGFSHAVLTISQDGTGINEKKQRFSDPKVYESKKDVNAETIIEIKKNITDTGIFAWAQLPKSDYKFIADKTLTFLFKDGTEITVPDRCVLPDQIKNGFFNIELEMIAKH